MRRDGRGGEEERRGEGSREGGVMGPAALEYLLSKEKERWKEGRREKKMKPSVNKQVGVMREDNKSFLSGHVGHDLVLTPPVLTTRCLCFYTYLYKMYFRFVQYYVVGVTC